MIGVILALAVMVAIVAVPAYVGDKIAARYPRFDTLIGYVVISVVVIGIFVAVSYTVH